MNVLGMSLPGDLRVWSVSFDAPAAGGAASADVLDCCGAANTGWTLKVSKAANKPTSLHSSSWAHITIL